MNKKVLHRSSAIWLEESVRTLVARIAELLAANAELYAEKRSRAELAELLDSPDWELRDMGITRSDIHKAINLPLDANAGQYLETVRRAGSLVAVSAS